MNKAIAAALVGALIVTGCAKPEPTPEEKLAGTYSGKVTMTAEMEKGLGPMAEAVKGAKNTLVLSPDKSATMTTVVSVPGMGQQTSTVTGSWQYTEGKVTLALTSASAGSQTQKMNQNLTFAVSPDFKTLTAEQAQSGSLVFTKAASG